MSVSADKKGDNMVAVRTVANMTRRVFVGGALAAANMARPAIAQRPSLLRFIPQANLSSLDPIVTTGYPIRNHGFFVYDTLYGLDENFVTRPQMAEGHEVSSDRLTWTIRLRDGLRFHDGEPVRSSDCVASIKRWAQRDGLGQTLMAMTDELVAIDDRSFRFRLKRPFPLLAATLGKASTPVPFIMPERIANTPASTQIRDATGSGPYRFRPQDWVPGSRAAYERFDLYSPRAEQASGSAGGKRAFVDRFEWLVIPDPATATAALLRNEADWYEKPDLNLIGLLRADKKIVIDAFDDGQTAILRFNHLQPPFNDIRVRQAVMKGVIQNDFLMAMVGDPTLFSECKSFFYCGTPMSSTAGAEAMSGNLSEARSLLKASSYSGEKVVILSPTDVAWLHAASQVAEDLMKQMGMTVELVATDLGTFFARRASTEPTSQGGWSAFIAGGGSVDFLSPAMHLALRGNGRAGWPGWPTDEALERLRSDWLNTEQQDQQKVLAADIQSEAFRSVPYVPLGQRKSPTALRNNVTGMLKGPAPFPWNVKVA